MIDKEMAIKIVNKIGSYGDIVLRSDLQEVAKFIDYQGKEIERLNNIIHLIKNNIDITIQIIKEQPTGNDEWILERLNGIKNIGELKGSDKE